MANVFLMVTALSYLLPLIKGAKEPVCLAGHTCINGPQLFPLEDNLKILLNLDLPLKDVNWYLEQFKKLKEEEAGISIRHSLRRTQFTVCPVNPPRCQEEQRNMVLRVAVDKKWQKVLDLGKMGTIQLDDLKREAEKEATQIYEDTLKKERNLKMMGKILKKDDPGYFHARVFKKNDPISRKGFKLGFIRDEATKIFEQKTNLSSEAITGLFLLGELETCKEKRTQLLIPAFQSQKAEDKMGNDTNEPEYVTCDPTAPYRSMDGSCNNLRHALRGSTFQKLRRILLPDYYLGISELRRDVMGDPLPSARIVSTTINKLPNSISENDNVLSSFHMTFGQFLDHDLSVTPMVEFEKSENGTSENEDMPLKCCDPELNTKSGTTTISAKFGCAPIDIPVDDVYYSAHGKTCMEFMRSSPVAKCDMGPREQSSEQSAYLDGSQIYGIKPPLSENDPLRTLKDGLLQHSEIKEDLDILPPNKDPGNECNTQEKMDIGEFCFLSGDRRVNEVVSLTFFHIVWSREHNRVVKILKSFHPGATDEFLYQETRRIVSAELQHIVYNEYLPTLIPYPLLEAQGLLPQFGCTQTMRYDPTEDVTIANSFATAAFRFGHSEIADMFRKKNRKGTVTNTELSSMLFNPFSLYLKGTVGDIGRGAFSSVATEIDPFFSIEVTGKMFRDKKDNNSAGMDLLAMNTQRGRDHGLPGYTKWLAKCGIDGIENFGDLVSVMTEDSIAALEAVYKHVDDIDLFAGGLSETRLKGGLMGHTFTCLLTDQFRRIKFGDRFWYEEKDQVGSFTPWQVSQLHQVSLARLMCNNLPELDAVQQFPMWLPGPNNPFIYCNCSGSPIPDFDLEPWK